MSIDEVRSGLVDADTIPETVKLVAAAAALAASAEAAQDVTGYREALEVRQRAQRQCGEMFLQLGRRAPPPSRFGIEHHLQRWREFARLDEERFEASVALLHRRWPRGTYRKKDPPPPAKVEMSLSAWETDESGCLTRRLVASGSTPQLKGEREHAAVSR
jgi:hypothetical protein